MKTMCIMMYAALAGALELAASNGIALAATNAVALTDAEVRMVERSRARRARAEEAARKATVRNRVEGIALHAPGMTRNALNSAQLGPHVGARAATGSARQMVPKTVFNRLRIIGMDARSIPGHVIYTYARGGETWCETNTVKAVNYKVAKNRYSKLKIIVAAKAAGKWSALKAGIEAADLVDEWHACQYIEDGDPSFIAATNAVVAAGIATSGEVAAFLRSAIDN